MADTFQIEIATPERAIVREQAVRAQIPCKDGYIGVLPDHAALVSELGIGPLTFVTPQGGKYVVAIKSGFVEVLDNHVRVLADVGETGTEIDVSRAERALKRSEQAAENPGEGSDPAEALIAMMAAQSRLEAAKKARANEE
jgi:F-type H+-transporting ATPase subunit epsilon